MRAALPPMPFRSKMDCAFPVSAVCPAERVKPEKDPVDPVDPVKNIYQNSLERKWNILDGNLDIPRGIC